MNKQEFENHKKPYTVIISVHPISNKKIVSYFKGWNNGDMKKKFIKDFPDYFTFVKLNKSAVNLRAKKLLNIKI